MFLSHFAWIYCFYKDIKDELHLDFLLWKNFKGKKMLQTMNLP